MRWLRRLIGVALVVAFMVGAWSFAAENDSRVEISYLWGEADVPLWQALLHAFGAGVGLTALGWFFFGVRGRLVQRRYRKAVGRLESEVHQLRNLPLAPDAPSDADAAPDGADARAGGRGA